MAKLALTYLMCVGIFFVSCGCKLSAIPGIMLLSAMPSVILWCFHGGTKEIVDKYFGEDG